MGTAVEVIEWISGIEHPITFRSIGHKLHESHGSGPGHGRWVISRLRCHHRVDQLMREAVFHCHLLNGWSIDLSVFDSGKIASPAGKCPPLPGLNNQLITGMIRAVGKINPPLSVYIFINVRL